jgi:hypothetical protein
MTKVNSAFEGMRVLATGSVAGIAAATVCPSQGCSFVNFSADTGNTGVVEIGLSTVTAGTNATVATAGFQLTAKAQSGFLPCSNLNNFYYISSSTLDWATYICIG